MHPPLLVPKASQPQAVAHALDRALNTASARALQRVVAEAAEVGLSPYLVGGIPRDLFLERSLEGGLNDLDVVVEGDAPALGRRLAERHGGRTVVHDRFQTATWHGPDADVDLVTARRERYEQAAALPITEPADLDADLRRRDFGINAVAIALSTECRGEIFDPCKGLDDLRSRNVRALHAQSFVDDPTRSIRAARFAARLGFDIDSATSDWIRSSRHAIDATSGARLAAELCKTMGEPSPKQVMETLTRHGVLEAIFPGLSEDPVSDAKLAGIDAELEHWRREGEPPLAPLPEESKEVWRLLHWLMLQGRHASEAAERLDLPHRQRTWLQEAHEAVRDLQSLVGTASVADSRLERCLERYSTPGLLLGASLAPAPLRDAILRFAFQITATPALVDGDDLSSLGVARGPEMGRLLKEIRALQLDQGLATREGGLAYALESIHQATTKASGSEG